MHNEEKKETGLTRRVNSLSNSVHKTEHDVREVKNKESQLEKKTNELKNGEDPFGELTGMHEIHMSPLMPHMPSMFDEMQMPHMMGMPHIQIIPLDGGEPSGMMHRFHSLGDFLKGMHKTGPAAEHHMGPILPENLLKPGAHPKHANKDKKDEKKAEDGKKEDAKKDDKKSDKKEDKPKSDGESHSV